MSHGMEVSGLRCLACGDAIVISGYDRDELVEGIRQVQNDRGECAPCVEGATPLDKQVRYQVTQWLGHHGLIPERPVLSIVEPATEPYVVITVRDGRTAKVWGRGGREELKEEVGRVLSTLFSGQGTSKV